MVEIKLATSLVILYVLWPDQQNIYQDLTYFQSKREVGPFIQK